jgi:hypothetical protein
MPTARDSICCHQRKSKEKLPEGATVYNDEPFLCITQHPGFIFNCLTSEVLDESWKSYRFMYGRACYKGELNKQRRHVGYRNCCRFIYNHVGRNNRIVLPACAVWAIRDKFPSADGNYTGFMYGQQQVD